MCKNDKCPINQTCYRFTATASEFRQSYGDFKYQLNNEGKLPCEYYWNNSEYK